MVNCNYSTAAGGEEPLVEKKAPVPLSGLILAGGAARRMNHADKGLTLWRGLPLIEHVARRIRPRVGQLLISCNRNMETYAEFADQLVSDRRPPFQGPLAGIESAVDAVTNPLLLVVPCDTPQLPMELPARLAAALQASPDADLAYARCDQRDHYLCAVLRRDSLRSLSAYLDSGGRAVRGWYATKATLAVDFGRAEAFVNINDIETGV